ncbi:AAA family ATPase [Spirosoma spitsbergense]|uniref:AAA family ATPase n=1 Tax=Spirosoma spitsbergense TaxID=431554 RepID=UPI000362220F|nr:AAA family ATPase [Spirosoma spitsbergense]
MITEQNKDTNSTANRPPLFDKTDEELEDSANYQFEPEEPESNYQAPPPPPDKKRAMLTRLLATEQTLSEAATKKVVFSPPLISREETGIIGRGTVNIIQGAFGSHKSRLAELLAALMLTNTETKEPQFLDFKRAVLERFCVCYIDTERNQKEELPYAVQGIKQRAGYRIEDQPETFRFTTIKGEKRADRFDAIETFIHHVREQTTLHLFCLIDVVTDAIGDFNDPKESMKLFDFLGNLCDNYDATFLLVIHQNPGTEKARGHTGTEAANKASTVLQIGLEKDASGNETDLIKLRYLKLRRGKKPEPLFLQFCKESNGLILAGADAIASQVNYRKHKADSDDVADRLASLLADGPMEKGEVSKVLESEFGAKNATIRGRLKQVIEEQLPMTDEQGNAVRLDEYRDGRQQYYRLKRLDEDEEPDTDENE